jgi:hypothetical protein
MAKEKTQYHYISGIYSIIKSSGRKESNSTSFICCTNTNNNPSGIPTMGYMTKSCRKYAESKGVKYVEGSFFIVSIIELNKEQYDALSNTEELEEE